MAHLHAGISVTLDADDVRIVARLLPTPAELRRNGTTLSPVVRTLFETIERAARLARDAQAPQAHDLPGASAASGSNGVGGVLTTEQAARRLGVSPQRVRQLIAARRLGATKHARRGWLIDTDSLIDHERHRQR